MKNNRKNAIIQWRYDLISAYRKRQAVLFEGTFCPHRAPV